MTFNEILAEVNSWTKRPDMDARARSAIRAVTLFYHRKEKFWRDLASVTVPGLAPATVQLVDIAANFPRFRQVCYVRIPAPSERYLAVVDSNDLLDNDGYAKDHVAFFAGTQLNIKSSDNPTSIEVCYWRDPVVSPEGAYSSWIADNHPDLIIAGAAKRIFAFDNESEIYKAAAAEEAMQFTELLQTNTEVQGR